LTSDRDVEEVISSEDVYPVDSPLNQSTMSNGYIHTRYSYNSAM